MTARNAKAIPLALLMIALLTGVYAVEATSDKKTLTDEECFELITTSIAEKEDGLELQPLKDSAKSDAKFNELKSNKKAEFKNTIQYWKADPDKCTVQLSKIAVKYNLDKDTENHKEVIVSLDGNSKEVINAELKEPYKIKHTNYSDDAINWAGITQMSGSTESTSTPTKAEAHFNVPYPGDPLQLNCGTGTNRCIVSVWAGLSEDWSGADTMVQSGTDSVCEGNNCANGRSYNAWLEKVDSNPSQDTCSGMTINHGDYVRAFTGYYDSTNKYSTGVYNFDGHDICTVSYTNEHEDAHYAHFVVERPQHNNNFFPLPSFADFDVKGKVSIDGSYHGIGDYGILGDTWLHNMKNSGITNIHPSWPDSSSNIHFDYISSAGAD